MNEISVEVISVTELSSTFESGFCSRTAILSFKDCTKPSKR